MSVSAFIVGYSKFNDSLCVGGGGINCVDLECRDRKNYGPSTLEPVYKDIHKHLHWSTTLKNCPCLEVETAGSKPYNGRILQLAEMDIGFWAQKAWILSHGQLIHAKWDDDLSTAWDVECMDDQSWIISGRKADKDNRKTSKSLVLFGYPHHSYKAHPGTAWDVQ
jgi:hypothetical protein